MTPEQEKQVLDYIKQLMAQGYSRPEIISLRDKFIEELKKKDEPQPSGQESTEPQEQPTTPSGQTTEKIDYESSFKPIIPTVQGLVSDIDKQIKASGGVQTDDAYLNWRSSLTKDARSFGEAVGYQEDSQKTDAERVRSAASSELNRRQLSPEEQAASQEVEKEILEGDLKKKQVYEPEKNWDELSVPFNYEVTSDFYKIATDVGLDDESANILNLDPRVKEGRYSEKQNASMSYAEKATNIYLDVISKGTPQKAEYFKNKYKKLKSTPEDQRDEDDEKWLRDLESEAMRTHANVNYFKLNKTASKISELNGKAVTEEKKQELNNLFEEYGALAQRLKGTAKADKLNRMQYSYANRIEAQEEEWKEKRAEELSKGDGKLAQFFSSITGAVSKGAISAAQVPKVLGDMLGDKDYDWADELFDSVVGTKRGLSGFYDALPDNVKSSDLPFFSRVALVGGSAIGSASLFAAGGLFGGASKVGQFASTMATSFLISEGDYYQEALESGMDMQAASFFSTYLSLQQGAIEGLIPDVKYLQTPAFRASVRNFAIKAWKSGFSIKEASQIGMKEALKASGQIVGSYAKAGTKEAFIEEVPSQFLEDATKSAVNAFGQKEYFKDTFNPDSYADAIIGSYVAGAGMNFLSKPNDKSPVQEELLREIAERKSKILESGTASDKQLNPNDKKAIQEVSVLLDSMKSHSSWGALSREEQNHALSLAHQAEVIKKEQEEMEKIGIVDEGKQEKLESIQRALSDMFSIQQGREKDAAKENKIKQLQDEFNKGLEDEVYPKFEQESKDAEIVEMQKKRKEAGVDDVIEFFADMKPMVAYSVERMEQGLPVPESVRRASSDYLYSKYKQLVDMMSDPNRMMTTEQIQTIKRQIESDLTLLEGGKIEGTAKEEGRELEVLNQKMSQFIGPRTSQLMNEKKISREEAAIKAQQEWDNTDNGKRRLELLNSNVNDQKDQTGLPSQVGEGQKPIEAQPIQGAGTQTTEASGVLQTSGQEEVRPVNEALKDVEGTAKALEGVRSAALEAPLLGEIAAGKIEGKTPNQVIAEAYHKAKADGSNPELVKAVEELLGKPKEATPQAGSVVGGEVELKPAELPTTTIEAEVVEEKPVTEQPTSETEGETTVTVGGTATERMRQRRGKRKGAPVSETQEKPKEEKPKEEKPTTGETKVSEVTPSVRPARAVEASEESNPEAGEDSAFEAAGMTREERDEWKKNNKAQGKKPKIEQLTQAVKDLVSGKKSFKDYYRMAKELMPSKLMDKVPIPATFKEIIGAIDSNKLKIGIVGLNKFVKKGMRVGLRIDIPSFNNHGKNVVTVHDRSKSGQEVIGYGSTGSIKNVNFRTSVPTAAKIGTGETSKSAFAMAEGEWMDESPESIQKRAEEAMNSPEWVQVSMNPARNSFFFDKADGNPVVSADEVLQVGNLVLAKNPKKIDLNTAEGMAEFERMFSTTDKKTGVRYQYRTAEKTTPGEVKTGRKFTGRAAVNRVVDFLKKANIDVELVSDDRFKEVQKGTALTGSLDGLFFTDEKSGKIYLRESKVDTHFGDILAFHEGIHPVMNIVAKTNPKLYDAIHDGLQNLAKENSETGREIRRVIETQKRFAEENGWDPSTLKDEIIVEALAIIAAKGLSIPQSQRGLRNAIIDFLNKIAKILNIPTKSRNVTDADFRAFAKKLSNAIREGGDIGDVINKRDIAAEAFSNTVTQDISAKGSIREFGKTGITKSPILDDDDFIKGVNTGVIKVLTPQAALSDNFFMMTFPDDLFVGKIIIDGNEVAAFGGGVIYAAVEGATGRVWASVNESTAKGFANNINRALTESKNGEAIVVLVKGDDIKHQSSLQGKVGFMKTLMNFAKGNKEYESQIINAIKGAYDLEKTEFDDVLKELDDYLSAGRDKSQETMKAAAVSYAAFRSSLINEASPMLKDMHEKMGYGDEFFNQTGLKKSPPVYRITNEFVDRIYADMLQEDFLNNLKPGSAYAAIKVRSEVTYVNDESHPSYPWVIKTVDGSGVELNIFSHTFMTYGPNEAVTGRGVEKGKSGGFGQTSYTTPTYKLDKGTNAKTPGAQKLRGKLSDYKKFKNKKSAKPSVSQERDMEPSLVDEAGLTKNMTEDGNGNYVFYHKTNKPLKTIDPKFFGKTLATSRDERPGVDISMYYTRPDAGESMVGGGYSYIVRIPKDKVYPINEDPLNLYDEAKRMFEKDYPGQAFDANKQVGYITKLAGQKGFQMTVTKWQKGALTLRAQTTTALKPEVHYSPIPGYMNAVNINEEIDAIEPNEVKMRREKRRAKGSVSQEREMESASEQKSNFKPNKVFAGINTEISDAASEYKEQNGLSDQTPNFVISVSEQDGKKIADAYEKMQHDPNNPEVNQGFTELISEIKKQAEVLLSMGYSFQLSKEGEGYGSDSKKMADDVKRNKRIFVDPSSKAYGTKRTFDKDNMGLQDSGYKDVNGVPMTNVELIRAVHDLFGHAEFGNGFGAIGEENAWRNHMSMFTPLAQRALTTTTRGQNSWVNFGPNMRNKDGSIKKKGDEGYLSPAERPFAEQKIGFLPDWAMENAYGDRVVVGGKTVVPTNKFISEGKEIYEINDAEAFYNAIASAKESRGLDGIQVTLKTKEEYQDVLDKGGRFLITKDGLSGMMIEADGNAGSGFVHNDVPKGQNTLKPMLLTAIKLGARYTDAYDTFLPKYYSKFGFKVLNRIPFNEEYAEEGWKETILSTKPDVVTMYWDGGSREKIDQNYDTFPPYDSSQGKVVDDYDLAIQETKDKSNEIEESASLVPPKIDQTTPKGTAKASVSQEREMEPSLVDENEFLDNSNETVDRVKSATGEDGATINLDGTEYNGGGLVVPAGSRNVSQSNVSASGLYKFLQDNLSKISSDIFKIGLYRFPDRPEVSYDLNIVIPSKYREIGIEFGRLSGQESLFDLDTFQNVKTGATGENPIDFTAEELAEIAIALSQGKMPNIPQKGITGTAKASTAQDRGMDPELAYNEVDRLIEDGENSGMNGQQMYDSISKTEAYASLSPEDRSLVNDTLRSMGAVTSDPAASSIMSYDAGEKAAVLDALRDNKDLAYIYRNFREILTDLKEKGIIETDCI